MDALTTYESGGEGEEEPVQESRKDEVAPLIMEESSSVLSRLKEKFPLNSAPDVPVRVSHVGR